jgi:hypothetical protein
MGYWSGAMAFVLGLIVSVYSASTESRGACAKIRRSDIGLGLIQTRIGDQNYSGQTVRGSYFRRDAKCRQC